MAPTVRLEKLVGQRSLFIRCSTQGFEASTSLLRPFRIRSCHSSPAWCGTDLISAGLTSSGVVESTITTLRPVHVILSAPTAFIITDRFAGQTSSIFRLLWRKGSIGAGPKGTERLVERYQDWVLCRSGEDGEIRVRMTAVLSPSSSSPSTSPQRLSTSSPGQANISPLGQTTSNPRRTVSQRPQSFAQQSRMSTYSTNSAPSHNVSRPISHVLPAFHSSLPYTLVRDFAYSVSTPLHFGPPAESSRATSGVSTPVSEFYRRLSDPNVPSWAGASSAGWSTYQYHQGEVPPYLMADSGPPYSEDEDLQSPVVKSSRTRKNKSTAAHLSSGSKRRAGPSERGSHLSMSGSQNGVQDRGMYTGTRSDGSEVYYFDSAPEQVANGPGGEFVAYPPNQSRRSMMATSEDSRRDSHFATILPSRSYVSQNGTQQEPPDDSDSDLSDTLSSPPAHPEDDSRMSRDYQFSIASPDEEMHGKAVALFDFTRENENELPLVEGQVIWVSYRHGQGWLVAEDPKTRGKRISA